MKLVNEILITVGVLTAVPLSGVIWSCIREFFRRLVFGYDVQALLAAKDIGGLHAALGYKRKESDRLVNYARSNAAIALGQIGDMRSLDRLLRALGDRDERVIHAAAQAIGQIVLRGLRQPLMQAGRASNQAAAQSLFAQLTKVQTKSVPPLIGAYRSHPEAVILMALGMLAGPQAAAFLEEVANSRSDAKLRRAALQSFLNTNDPRGGRLLLAKLKDTNAGMRAMAAELAGQYGLKAGGSVLAGLLDDSEPAVRRAAARALGELADAQAADKLLEKLKQEKTDDIRESIIQTLGKLRDPRAVESLIPLVADPQPSVRKQAAGALALLGDKKWAELIKGEWEDFIRLGKAKAPMALAALLDLARSRDSGQRLVAVRGLAELADPKAAETLLGALADSHPPVQIAAVQAAAGLKINGASDAIRRLLVNANPEVRAAAAAGLEAMGEPQWRQWVKGDAQDVARLGEARDPQVFDLLLAAADEKDAVVALGKTRNPKAVPVLLEMIRKPAHPLCLTAVRALGDLGDSKATAALTELLKTEDNPLRLAVVQALKRIGDKKAVKALAGLLAGRATEEILAETAAALAALKDAKACEPLRGLLTDGRGQVRLAAVAALAELGEPHWREWVKGRKEDYAALAKSGRPESYDLLIRALESDPDEPQTVMEALGVLGDRRAVPALRDALASQDTRYPKAAAKTLAQLGEAQWQACLRPNRIETLSCLAQNGLQRATRLLIGELNSYRSVRVEAARALIKLATAPDKELKNAWSEVFRLINQPHTDTHSDDHRSSDCTHSDHTDVGIGLSFPETYEK